MDNSLSLVLILLATAVAVVVLCRILRLPVMLGYLTVGLLIGPHALAWIPESIETQHLAEFGVVFLMFSIGLEFSLARLMAMKRTVFGLGGAQVLCSLLVVIGLAMLFGSSWRAGLALGGVLAMSSTAIVSKMLVERAELNLPYGRQMMGVLLFQDLAVVPLLIVIPALAENSADLPVTLGLAILKAAMVLALLLVFGQRMMRPWFHVVARQKSSELFMLNVLLITLGLAYLTEYAGLSLALGAFVAGMLISETEYRYQVEEDIKPFRDVLLGLFFVTIGMRLDLGAVVGDLGWVLLVLAGIILIKAVIVTVLARVFERDLGVALRSGIGLAQAGEFGFVLLTLTESGHFVPAATLQICLAAMLLSMLAAPFLIQHGEVIARRFSAAEWTNRAMQMHQIAIQSMSMGNNAHVIICGYGRSGAALGNFLEQEKLRFIALDLDSRRVREASAAKKSVVYGDAAKREVLMAAGLMRASALVISYTDKHSALAILRHVKELRPDLPVIVRTTDDVDVEALKQAGAAEVVAEVVEGSVMLASQVLLMAGVPLNRVIRQIQESRARRYAVFSGYFRSADVGEATERLQPRFLRVFLKQEHAAVGMRLREIGLDKLNVEVNAVRRHGVRDSQPSEEAVLQAGDVLVLLGLPEALLQAELLLHKGL